MSNFDMRIPIKDMNLVERKDGSFVLQLQPAFSSVDPIFVDVPEAVFAKLVSGFPEALARNAADVTVAEGGTGIMPLAREMGAPISLKPISRVSTPLQAAAAGPMLEVPAANGSGDEELTTEEMEWLARSAG